MIGLGRMGGNMAQRLLSAGHRVVAFDRDREAVDAASSAGAVAAGSLEDLAFQLAIPRAVWLMLPAGDVTEGTIDALVPFLSPGDVVLDGGNAYYKDTMRRGEKLAAHGLELMDVGTSGGVWGLSQGYSLMVGGSSEAFARLEPVFQALAPAPDRGYSRVGPTGAGHFVKMVHNGVEYGLMQAYAEGLELLEAKADFDLDLGQIAETWRHGSVVRSWLLDLAVAALEEDPGLESLRSYVEDSGEGRWTVQEAVDLGVPIPVITLALQQRFRSRQEEPFGGRMLAALRRQFGGHAVRQQD